MDSPLRFEGVAYEASGVLEGIESDGGKGSRGGL